MVAAQYRLGSRFSDPPWPCCRRGRNSAAQRGRPTTKLLWVLQPYMRLPGNASLQYRALVCRAEVFAPVNAFGTACRRVRAQPRRDGQLCTACRRGRQPATATPVLTVAATMPAPAPTFISVRRDTCAVGGRAPPAGSGWVTSAMKFLSVIVRRHGRHMPAAGMHVGMPTTLGACPRCRTDRLNAPTPRRHSRPSAIGSPRDRPTRRERCWGRSPTCAAAAVGSPANNRDDRRG